jgi:hypothetical protein
MNKDIRQILILGGCVAAMFLVASLLSPVSPAKSDPAPCATMPTGKQWCIDYYPPKP